MISPASVVSVAISSFPECLSTCPTTAVRMPTAAILKMISTPTHTSYNSNNATRTPKIMPSLIYKEPYFFFSSSQEPSMAENLPL